MRKEVMGRRRMKRRRIYSKYCSLRSSGCYFSAGECVDAELEPGAGGIMM